MTSGIAIISIAADVLRAIDSRVAISWPWYVIRGSGFVAAGLLLLLMLSGIGQVTGIIYRFIEPIHAWAIHKALGFALVASIGLHIGFLLIDKFARFSLSQLFIPYASTYNNGTKFLGLPFGSLAVSFGILALYGVAIIMATSLGWIDSRKRAWRRIHYVSYAIALLVFLHALYIGTDVKYGLFRDAWLLLGAIGIGAVLIRLWRAGTIKKTSV